MRGSAFATSLAVVALALTAPGARAQPRGEDESAALVAAGRAALGRGELGAAAKALDQALALNPRRLEAYALRAAVHAARGEHARGVALMRKARELAPDSDDVAAALGTQLVLAGQVDEGVPLLEAVVGRGGARYEAHALLGHHYAAHGRWAQAVTSLEAYLASRPAALGGDDDRHRLDLANAYLRARRPADARDAYRGLAERHPDWRTARLGQAWATAALDCRQARPLLAELAAEPESPADVALVDGQCALALGATDDALARARAFLAATDGSSAAGQALLGEALAARGELGGATAALRTARTLEPARRSFAVRLARVLRLGRDPAGALTELDAIGAPAAPDEDLAYWVERGEALLALDRPADAVAALTPVAVASPDHGLVLTVLGDAALATGDAPAAVRHLEAALAARTVPAGERARPRLSAALVTLGEAALVGGDLPAAEQSLRRASEVAPTAAAWRGLGLVALAAGRADDALEPLIRAAAAEREPVARILLGRAHAARGDTTAARAAFVEAAGLATGARAVDVALERAAFEVDAGAPLAAVEALTGLPAAARTLPGAAARVDAALTTARHAAGLRLLADGQAGRGAELLDEAARLATGDEATAIRCDAALAAVATGDRARARARLAAIAKLRCPFPAPADTQAVPILTAFVDGLDPRRAAKAVDRLTALSRGASGVSAQLAATALRVVALTAAEQAYRASKLDAARKLLATARAVEVRAGGDELIHDLAVLALAKGELGDARIAFQKVVARVPEASIGLGVIADREGDGARALELWRAARKAGARFAALDEWIAAKERLYGGGTP